MRRIYSRQPLVHIFAAALLLLIIAGGLALVQFHGVKSPLVVHYDVYRGLNILGSKSSIFSMIALALALFALNGAIAATSAEKETGVAYFSAITSACVNFFVLVQVIALINFNL